MSITVSRISDFHKFSDDSQGETHIVQGWVMLKRKQNDLTFLELNDGSSCKNIQCTIPSSIADNFTFKQGEYVKCRGVVQQTPNNNGG